MTLLLTHSLGAAAERKELEKRHSSVHGNSALALSPSPPLYMLAIAGSEYLAIYRCDGK
jgi:hypothetical protein